MLALPLAQQPQHPQLSGGCAASPTSAAARIRGKKLHLLARQPALRKSSVNKYLSAPPSESQTVKLHWLRWKTSGFNLTKDTNVSLFYGVGW